MASRTAAPVDSSSTGAVPLEQSINTDPLEVDDNAPATPEEVQALARDAALVRLSNGDTAPDVIETADVPPVLDSDLPRSGRVLEYVRAAEGGVPYLVVHQYVCILLTPPQLPNFPPIPGRVVQVSLGDVVLISPDRDSERPLSTGAVVLDPQYVPPVIEPEADPAASA